MLRLYIYCAFALNDAMQFFRHFLLVMIVLTLPFLAGAQEGVDQTDLTAQFLEDRIAAIEAQTCLLYTSPSPRDQRGSRMPSSA